MLSREVAHIMFDLDKENGRLFWKHRPMSHFATSRGWAVFNSRFPGTEAGSIDGDGYRNIACFETGYGAHRIVWVMVNGDMPGGMFIDHLNGIRHDNRPENLRLVPRVLNARNARKRKDNTTGHTGVHWDAKSNKFRARVWTSNGRMNLGLFHTAAAAGEAVQKFKSDHGYTERHGR